MIEVDLGHELALLGRVQDPDPEERKRAEAEVVEQFERLVRREARRFGYLSQYWPHYGPEDMFQQGRWGLIIAARRFDCSRGCRFMTTAVQWIRQKIATGPIRSRRNLELARDRRRVGQANHCSLDAPATLDGSLRRDLFPDYGEASPFTRVVAAEELVEIKGRLTRFYTVVGLVVKNPHHRDIFFRRHGIGSSGRGVPMRVVAEEFGVSHQGVSQICQRITKRLVDLGEPDPRFCFEWEISRAQTLLGIADPDGTTNPFDWPPAVLSPAEKEDLAERLRVCRFRTRRRKKLV